MFERLKQALFGRTQRKDQPGPEPRQDILALMKQYVTDSGDFEITPAGVRMHSVSFTAAFQKSKHTTIPIKFAEVHHFSCKGCTQLTSLDGVPESVTGVFDCSDCHGLTSLQGAPKEVGMLRIHNCLNLVTLRGVPEKIAGECAISNCPKLTEVETGPEAVWLNLRISNCPVTEVQSLSTHIARSLMLENTGMTTIPPIPENTKHLAWLAPTITKDEFRNILTLAPYDITGPSTAMWWQVLNQYYSDNDLLALMAKYEALYGEPYQPTTPYVEDAISL